MAWTASLSTVSTGSVLTATEYNNLIGNVNEFSLAWTSWTPTWTGLTVGNATQESKYVRAGRLVVARLYIKFGSTSSFSGNFTATLPVTAATVTPAYLSLGYGSILDSGAAVYQAFARQDTTARVSFFVMNAAGTYVSENTVSNTTPMTWTTNDEITIQMVYEAASA